MKFLNNSICAWSAAVVVGASPVTILAAGSVDSASQQIQRTNLTQRLQDPAVEAVPSLYQGESSDVGQQFVVKAQKAKPKQEWLEAAFDIQFGTTTNALLSDSATRDSTLMISTAQIAVAPTPWEVSGGQLAVKAGYRHQKFNYGKLAGNERSLNDLDFDVSTIFAQGRYLFNEHWVASAGVDYNRLLSAARSFPTDPGMYTEFYTEVVPSIGLARNFKIDEKSMFTASVTGNWHVTQIDDPNTDHNDRIDEVLMASYVRELAPNLVVQPFYSASFTQFTRVHSRKDIVQTVGVTVAYAINKWASVRASANWEGRESTGSTSNNYEKLDTGLGVSFLARF